MRISMNPPHHRVWNQCRRRGWRGAVSHVQAGHPRRHHGSTIFEFGSRSAVPVPPMGANLRILGVTETKTVPYVPWSHPFVERLIGTIRRECLDRLLFWTGTDLERKLVVFQQYYNEHRSHAARAGRPPAPRPETTGARASLQEYRWQSHCRGLYHTPRAA